MQVKVVDESAEAAEQEIPEDNYWGLEEAGVQVLQAGGPFSDDRAGLYTYLRAFTGSPSGLFNRTAPGVQIYTIRTPKNIWMETRL